MFRHRVANNRDADRYIPLHETLAAVAACPAPPEAALPATVGAVLSRLHAPDAEAGSAPKAASERDGAGALSQTELVSLVAHELRNPLTSVAGYVGLLLDGEVGNLSDKQRETLAVVQRNVSRLISLTTDLLDAQRVESGRLVIRRSVVDVREVLREAAGAVWPLFGTKQQRLAVEIPPVLPRVEGDAVRLTQVVVNLLSNAHKYTPRGGRIDLAAQVRGGRLEVEVRDTGIGIDPEDQSRLFTRFFRSARAEAQEAPGTGLGLFITRSLIELHSGDIRVQSALGQGSVFTVTLPLARDESGAAPELPLRSAAPGRPRKPAVRVA